MIREYNGIRPDVSRAAFIAETAVIIGDVVLEEGVSIWYGAVLRGDSGPIRVGRNSNIQDNCVVHCDAGGSVEIEDHVLIGHGAIIHGCTIKRGSMIGMGAVVLNHSVIPEGSLVGAGSLVTERKTFPAGSLILGSPAKAVRPLTEQQKKELPEDVQVYVRLGAEYAGK